MIVLCKGYLFELLLLGTTINHKLRLYYCHHQLNEDQATKSLASINLVGLLKNSLAGI